MDKDKLKKKIEEKFNLNGSYTAYLEECDKIKKELDDMTLQEMIKFRKQLFLILDKKLS